MDSIHFPQGKRRGFQSAADQDKGLDSRFERRQDRAPYGAPANAGIGQRFVDEALFGLGVSGVRSGGRNLRATVRLRRVSSAL